MKSKSFSDRKVQIALGSAILCLFVVSLVSFRSMAISNKSEVWVRHTHRVLETLQRSDFRVAGAQNQLCIHASAS
jgi:hypothetical protein